MPGHTGCDSVDGADDEGRKERVRSLAAAALAVVEQAIDNPELFEGIFDQARAVLSDLGVDGYAEANGAELGGNSNNINHPNDDDGINWEELERESQELVCVRANWFMAIRDVMPT
ncbi:hypothetical protein ACQJBY_052134 [Aegilops geniculata]